MNRQAAEAGGYGSAARRHWIMTSNRNLDSDFSESANGFVGAAYGEEFFLGLLDRFCR